MKKIYLGKNDWETICKTSLEDYTGFLIDTSINYKDYLDNEDISKIKEIYTLDSIYSYKFGMSNQVEANDPILKRLYTCKCHKMYGLENLDTPCSSCGTYVQKSIPMSYGWIDLGKNRVLHIYLCELLSKTYRQIEFDKKSDKFEISNINENYDDDDEELSLNKNEDEDVETEKAPKSSKKKKNKEPNKKVQKYSLFDLLTKNKLKYTWDDILYGGKLNDFLNTYFKDNPLAIINTMGKLTTNKIMVLSAEYRPIKIQKFINVPEITQDVLNTKYMNICDTVKILMENDDYMLKAVRINHLVSIMKNMAEIAKIINNALSANKKSIVRQDIYSKRWLNSARCVLEAITDPSITDIEECIIDVDVFRGIFSKDVERILNDFPDKDSEDRYRLLNIDVSLTDEEYKFIETEIFPRLEAPFIYMNREPCIYPTSSLSLKIAKLSRDKCIRISSLLLPAIKGDYDGDETPIINMGETSFRVRVSEMLSPRKSIIDTIKIGYNSNIGVNNNMAVLLYLGYQEDAVIKRID